MSKKLQAITDGTDYISYTQGGSRWVNVTYFSPELLEDDWFLSGGEGDYQPEPTGYYHMTAGWVGMPSDWYQDFNTLEELRAEMGDLRHWVINNYAG